METFAVWQSRPVFVTSTFRDFQAERDHLHRFVFPELEERLKARFHHLEPIDLRWGVDTASAAEEETKQRLVLKVCLAEIARSRPFLVGLIGDRYGWVPPLERMQAAAEEAGHRGALAGKSVTALEIEYGVLDSSEQAGRSRFYFRAPLPYDQMDPKTAAGYSERHTGEPDAAAAQVQLDALKARIKLELPGRWATYQAEWDEEHQCVTGLDAWGRQVLEDLWSDLETETRAYAARAAGTWQQQEALILEQFIEGRCRDFVGRTERLAELRRLARSPAEPDTAWGACLTGPAGAGKSALFAKLHRQLAQEDLLLLAHAAGISNRATRVEDLLRRWIGELAAALQIPDPSEGLTKADELEQTFASLLGRAAMQRRVVCLLDALDQFEPTPAAQYLTWLPKLWPPNARLIATAIPGSASTALEQRPGVTALALPPLDRGEAEQIADTLCRRYHKTLPAPVRDCLAQKLRPDGQPAAGIPLWLELALDELLLLDADDFARAHGLPGDSAGERLRALLVAVAENLPPEVETLYGYLLARAEELHGTAWADGLVNLVALSRGGWRESDLQVLLPKVSGQPWSDLAFAGLRRSLRAHLVQRGAQAQWDFAHAQLRAAVERRNLSDPGGRRALHTMLADHLESLATEDALRQTELMYHLIWADDRPRAAAYYAGLEIGTLVSSLPGFGWQAAGNYAGLELAGATGTLAKHLLAGEAQTPNARLTWALALFELPGQIPAITGKLCTNYLFQLGDALENVACVRLRLALFEGAQQVLERLAAADPGKAEWQRDLLASHQKVGDGLVAQGNLAGALRAYRASLAITERLAATDPRKAEWQRDLSVSHSKVGDALVAQGDLAGALRAYRASLVIAERLATTDPGNAGGKHDLSLCHSRVGDVLMAQGDLAGALRAYRASLEIAERLATADPGNARWQRGLSASYERLGNVLVAQGELAGAQRAYWASLEIAERLAACDPGNAGWQRVLSVSYIMVGEVLVAQGDLAGALRTYQESLSIGARLAAADPGNAEWQRGLSDSHSKVGEGLVAQGDLAGALRAYRASLAIRERLAAADPGNAEWQRGLSISHSKVGDGLVAQGDLAGALRAYRVSLAIHERLAAADPSHARWQRDLLISHERLGDVLVAQGDIAGALLAYRASLAIGERLVASNPGNADWQRALSVSHIKVGDGLVAQGDIAGALRAYRVSLAIRERLAAADPSHAGWQCDLSISHSKVGDVLVAQGDLAGALRAYRVHTAIHERLAAADPSHTGWQHDLSVSHERVGDVLVAQGDLAGAQHAYRASLAIRERLAAADPGNAEWQRGLSISHIKVGDGLVAHGDLAGALRAYRVSLAIDERLAATDPSHAGRQRDLSVSHSKVGDVLVAQGDLAGALRAYRVSLAIGERLVAADPSHAGWQRDLSISHRAVGDVLVAQGDLAGALGAHRVSLAIRERLTAADPGNAWWQRDLWFSHARVATVLEQSGDADAGTHWSRAYVVLSGMKRGGLFLSPQDAQVLEQLRWKVQAGTLGTLLSGNSGQTVPFGETHESAGPPAPGQGSTAVPAHQNAIDLDRVRALLNEGTPDAALQLIGTGRDEPPAVKNAHAVCLLRLGQAEPAIRLLRQLVLPNEVFSIPPDIPDTYKLNFATALLMEGNIDGCLNALSALKNRDHPTAKKLRAALDRWRKGLSFGQRFKLSMGSVPDVPIALGFPPGEL